MSERLELVLKFNKPAVDKFFSKAAANWRRYAVGLDITIDQKNSFMMRPNWSDATSELVNIEYNDRGAATVTIGNHLTEQAIRTLDNPYNNPFFTLSEMGSWIVAAPYKSSTASVRKLESPRLIPILRVWSTTGIPSHILSERDKPYIDDLVFEKVLRAASIIKSVGDKEVRITSEELQNAQILLEKFELTAWKALPNLRELDRRIRELITLLPPARKNSSD